MRRYAVIFMILLLLVPAAGISAKGLLRRRRSALRLPGIFCWTALSAIRLPSMA